MDTLAAPKSLPNPGGWTAPALFTATFALLMALSAIYDERIVTWVRFGLLPSDSTIYRIVKFSQWFTGWVPCCVFVAILLVSPNRLKLLLGFSIPLLLVTGLTHLMKLLLGRARPEKELGPASFTFLGDPNNGFDSFPSGHTSFAIALALLFGAVFPKLRIPFLVFALLTAFTRIAQARHYPSDVLAAAALAFILVTLLKRRFGPDFYRWTPPAESNSGSSI